MPSPCRPPITGLPGTGWHVEHGTPPALLRRRLDVRRVRAAARRPGRSTDRAAGRRRSRAVARGAREHAPGWSWQLVHAGAPGAACVTPAGRDSVPSWQRPHAFGSSGRASATSATRQDGAVKAGRARVDDARSCTSLANAGVPPATHAVSVAWSAAPSRPTCGAVPSAARIGADRPSAASPARPTARRTRSRPGTTSRSIRPRDWRRRGT